MGNQSVKAPKATAPKATAPKATAPKATAPKATAPKATAPKATAPKADEKAIQALYTNAGIAEYYGLTVQETAQKIASVDGSLFNAFVALVIKCAGNRSDVYAACEAANVADSTKRVYYGRVVEKFHAGKLALPASIGNALPAARAPKAPAADSKVPAADSKAPAADSKAPAADSKAPAADSKAGTFHDATGKEVSASAFALQQQVVKLAESADFASALFQLASRDAEVYANLATAARSFGILFSKASK